MSVCVEYFFNRPENLAEVGELISSCLGCNLKPYEGNADDLFARFLNMEFSLSTHIFENDREADFENFRYYIDFRTAMPESNARTIQIAAMLTVIHALHRYHGITGMFVYELQTVLARYEERDLGEHGKFLYDLLSEEYFTNFSEHLLDIEKRLPKRL